MDHRRNTVKRRAAERGVAMVMAFSVSVILLGLIAALYWITVQRHTLMRKRGEHARGLYLTEAGMHDAIARLRIGTNPPGIDPTVGRWYCLDVATAPPTPTDIADCSAACPADQVRVCVSDNGSGRNQIDVTANF